MFLEGVGIEHTIADEEMGGNWKERMRSRKKVSLM
jgi:hypothetical protein